MAKIERFEDLKIWQGAIEVAVDVYRISGSGKLKNDFGAVDQIRRSATSISNNIAEGFEYNNNRDFVRYLRFAKGSCGELRSQLVILSRIGYVSPEEYQNLRTRLLSPSRQISSLLNHLKRRLDNPKNPNTP